MGQALPVVRCDLHASTNNPEHRTDGIGARGLVVRRGRPFQVTLTLSATQPPCSPRIPTFTLVARTGAQAGGAEAVFPVSGHADGTRWSAAVKERDPRRWVLSVTSPADAGVGRYSLLLQGSGKTRRLLGRFALLFNPWARGDAVFLEGEAQREEYLLNPHGLIFLGTQGGGWPRPWDFGQSDLVDFCLLLLDVDEEGRSRGDPVHVSRLLGAVRLGEYDTAVNGHTFPASPLAGSRPGTHPGSGFPGRTRPRSSAAMCRGASWASEKGLNLIRERGIPAGSGTEARREEASAVREPGSVPTLREWVARPPGPAHRSPDWVLAACTCSALRAVGIPARVVTAFGCARDTDGGWTVEEFYDDEGLEAAGAPESRIWASRVWTECWMARPDLSSGYGGWQVLDPLATEGGGERSWQDALACCDLTPVRAVKEGAVAVAPGVSRLFASLNSACAVWVRSGAGPPSRASAGAEYLGNYISTKGVDGDRCEDVTRTYKYPEGSPREAEVLDGVWKERDRSEPRADLFVSLHAPSSFPLDGGAQLKVTVSNRSDEERAVRLTLGAQVLYSTGRLGARLWREERHLTLEGNRDRTFTTGVEFRESGRALENSSSLRLTAVGVDRSAGTCCFAREDVTAYKARATLEIPRTAVQFQPITAVIGIHNDLASSLDNCEVAIAGRGLVHRERIYRLGSVQPRGLLRKQIRLTPTHPGVLRLTARVSCGQFRNLVAFRSVNVAKAEPPA
ncbi:protein 4.2 [Ornithorhynchus anatinus]|uniref:protein 4.2 n=1 Tax=Ornithorhynchus anatinus TaxID=9258 RepID=UPI0019D42320|nr:protein 4.2 [Ornithorhynchus anatinus]